MDASLSETPQSSALLSPQRPVILPHHRSRQTPPESRVRPGVTLSPQRGVRFRETASPNSGMKHSQSQPRPLPSGGFLSNGLQRRRIARYASQGPRAPAQVAFNAGDVAYPQSRHYAGRNGFNALWTPAAGPLRPNLRPKWTDGKEAKFLVRGFAPLCDTQDIHRILQKVGNVIYIDIPSLRHADSTDAFIVFETSSVDTQYINNGIVVQDAGASQFIQFESKALPEPRVTISPRNPRRTFCEKIVVDAAELSFGIMESPTTMAVKHSVMSTTETPLGIEVDTKRKTLDINFGMTFEGRQADRDGNLRQEYRHYKIRLELPQMHEMVQMQKEEELAFVFSVEMPPLVFRKASDPLSTHQARATSWNQHKSWYRQSGVYTIFAEPARTATQLYNQQAIIDVGRWLTYRVVFNKESVASSSFREMCEALTDHDIRIEDNTMLNFSSEAKGLVWSWLDAPLSTPTPSFNSPTLSGLDEMAHDTVFLSFEMRYQLEVCISNGFFVESNLSEDFLKRLKMMGDSGDKDRAVRLLEKVASQKNCFYDPNEIFGSLQLQTSRRQKVPAYCAMIRSAVVTPTTIYFATPILEATNRIIRQYHQYRDRFLRVRFTDEKYKGRVRAGEDASMNEVLTRIKMTMTNGIKVGGRHYEFLAFGNAQFREHGAYFFAPTSALSAADIRAAMGTFSHINVVAKYCSRLGQCFSTTRASDYFFNVNVERLAEVERNGYCFSDGVGKISPFLAKMIAYELGKSTSNDLYPSAFQFRLGGCKGVLAVDPSLSGSVVQIRPSQEKFPAESRGLEICRISQFSAVFLNIQLILVLSALGVEDGVFLRKMAGMLADLNLAMVDKDKAVELLQKNVDLNQMTLQLAAMIQDGFMETRDPFTVSCIRLWRSWTTKFLKEKARILVDEGAFVLGILDETGLLKGHVEADDNHDEVLHDISKLPEIFIQVSDPGGTRPPKVIEGVCVLTRNPALHPGDSRVVMAVKKPELMHIRDCVVLPQTGDRPLANMCSGGDLDGDDFLVMWDKELLPPEWNHPAMDYTAPPPVISEGEPTVDDMTSFFVTHMKYDNLGQIAVNHRCWADALLDGVKDPKCLQLAELHSQAVDYAKNGTPAELPADLKIKQKPHWAEPKFGKTYQSNKVLGKLYDTVQRVKFEAAWDLPFDERILNAYEPADELLQTAADVKLGYDEAVRRIMARFSVKSEFEVWTTFALEHTDSSNDYKFAETIGEATQALRDSHRKLCYEAAGTTDTDRAWTKMAPFIAAMYRVTAVQVQAALIECKKTKYVGGRYFPVMEKSFDTMPFMSFPWLFPTELGLIANKREAEEGLKQGYMSFQKQQLPPRKDFNLLSNIELPPLKEIQTSDGPVQHGEVFTLFDRDDSSMEPSSSDSLEAAETKPAENSPYSVDEDVFPHHTIQAASVVEKSPPKPLSTSYDVIASKAPTSGSGTPILAKHEQQARAVPIFSEDSAQLTPLSEWSPSLQSIDTQYVVISGEDTALEVATPKSGEEHGQKLLVDSLVEEAGQGDTGAKYEAGVPIGMSAQEQAVKEQAFNLPVEKMAPVGNGKDGEEEKDGTTNAEQRVEDELVDGNPESIEDGEEVKIAPVSTAFDSLARLLGF